MVKQVISFAADDGTRFDTEAQAAEHDLKVAVLNLVLTDESIGLSAQAAEVAVFMTAYAETLLPHIKAIAGARTRTVTQESVVAADAPAVLTRGKLVALEKTEDVADTLKRPARPELEETIVQDGGKWFCRAKDGLEEMGPFESRDEAVAYCRSVD